MQPLGGPGQTSWREAGTWWMSALARRRGGEGGVLQAQEPAGLKTRGVAGMANSGKCRRVWNMGLGGQWAGEAGPSGWGGAAADGKIGRASCRERV